MARNQVMAGDYLNKVVSITMKGELFLGIGFGKRLMLNKDTIESFELITEEHKTSAVSAVGRGAVGVALLGPIGLLAGLSAKDVGSHMVAIEFKDGKKSLIDLSANYHKILNQIMF